MVLELLLPPDRSKLMIHEPRIQNLVSIAQTITLETPQTAPEDTTVLLPGRFIIGVECWSDKIPDVTMRFTENDGQIFPDPTGHEAGDWYRPVLGNYIPLFIPVGGRPPKIKIEFANANVANAEVVVNILASEDHPDQQAIYSVVALHTIAQAMEGMRPGWERLRRLIEQLSA